MAGETLPGDEPAAEEPKYDQAFFLALAAKGKNEWNEWRRANKDVYVTFAEVDFSEAPNDKIDFTGFEFGDYADFSGCNWHGGSIPIADFGAFFRSRACFTRAVFGDHAKFYCATFGGTASFQDATFCSGANFAGADFVGGAFFDGTTFGALPQFIGTTFVLGPSSNARPSSTMPASLARTLVTSPGSTTRFFMVVLSSLEHPPTNGAELLKSIRMRGLRKPGLRWKIGTWNYGNAPGLTFS